MVIFLNIFILFLCSNLLNGYNSKRAPLVDRTQITQLNKCHLTEEINLHTYLKLVDFNRLLNLTEFSSIKRLQLMIGSVEANSSTGQMFYINETDMSLSTNHSFDRELLIKTGKCEHDKPNDCIIKLKIAGYDERQQLVKMFLQSVQINDVNDNVPMFRQSVYQVNVSENLLQKTFIPLEPPIDYDAPKNGIQSCHIYNSSNILFNAFYNKFTMRLFLVVNEPLDRENSSSFNLILSCTDGLNSTEAELIVNVLDANDNTPYFNQKLFNASIFENEGVQPANEIRYRHLIQIQAFDKDDTNSPNGRLVYSLPVELNFNYENLFQIESRTGWLSVNQNELDYEKQKYYLLKVKVTDSGPNPNAAYTDVLINVLDLNDNVPKAHLTFVDLVIKENKSNNTIWIKEELPNAITIAYLTLTDLDSALTNGNRLSANITDANMPFKLVPIIQDYENLYYALQVNGRLDREEFEFYELIIQLSDSSLTNQKVVYLNLRIILVDINDNAPAFKSKIFKFELKENNEVRINLARIEATDMDLNNKLTYEIVEGASMFNIHNTAGWLQAIKSFDREETSSLKLKIRCHDNAGLFNDLDVVVEVLDQNDNLPTFLNNNLYLKLFENVERGTIVGNLDVHDADLNPSTKFLIEPLIWRNYFQINNLTGDLITIRSIDADLPTSNLIQLSITAIDLQLKSSTKFNKLNITINLIDQNDNPPIIHNNKSVIIFNLATNNSKVLNTFESTDPDRTFALNQSIKFLSIQRFSWQFVNQLVKNELHNSNKTEEILLIDRVQNIIDLQRDQKVKPIFDLSLRDIFFLESTFSNASFKLNKLMIMHPENPIINWGVYNLTISIADISSEINGSLETELNMKVLVYNASNSTNFFTDEQLGHLNMLINTWSINNADLTINHRFDNNGDDMETTEQEYVRFYARAAQSIFKNFNSETIKEFVFANSSITIICVISLFIIISIMLISIITYKHYKVSIFKNGMNKISSSPMAGNGFNAENKKPVQHSEIDNIEIPDTSVFKHSPSNSFFENSNFDRRNNPLGSNKFKSASSRNKFCTKQMKISTNIVRDTDKQVNHHLDI